MGDFKQLKVWQQAQRLSSQVYEVTSTFPSSERFNLIDQMRRSAESVSSNICEGSGRGGDKEFIRFLRIAQGSLTELEGQLLSARRAGYLGGKDWDSISATRQEVGRMLNGLIDFLRRSVASRAK